MFTCDLSTQQTESKTIESWEEYYDRTSKGKPFLTLVYAHKKFISEGKTSGIAFDLGSGAGTDSLYLLNKGWSVVAVDEQPAAIEMLSNRAPEYAGFLEMKNLSFTNLELPENIDLVNASYSLHFISPHEFPSFWENIASHLALGGRFSGHLLGDKDDWAQDPSFSSHTYEAVLELLEKHFHIEFFEVKEGTSPDIDGNPKQWHIYNIVAKKIRL